MSHFFKAILPRLFTLMRFCARLWERVGRKIKLTRKIFLPAAIACMALAGMESAYAATAQCSTAFNPTRVDFNQVNIPPNAQVGDVLASVTVDFPVNCPANPNASGPSGFYLTYLANSAYRPSSTVDGAWELPSPTLGMGIRITNITHDNMVLRGQSCNGTAIVLDMNCFFAPAGLTTIPTAFSLPIKFRVELVKTATNTATGTPGATIMAFRNYDVVSKTMSNSYGNLWFGAMTPTVSTCTVLTPNLSVTLPTLKVSDLSPGKPTGDTPFQIDLSCSGGKSIYVTLTDAADPGNRSSLLSLSSQSTARNVKLQIVKADKSLVNFGPPTAVANNPGQWKVDSSGAAGTTGNARSIDLVAQYVSTGAVTPGSVEAAAMFTLYYP